MIDETFAALADPTRRAAVDLLRTEPRRAGDLARTLAVSPPTMSRHLKVLRDAGLVTPDGDDADARLRIYRLCPGPFGELGRWVAEVEAYWGAQLGAFQAHVERTRGDR